MKKIMIAVIVISLILAGCQLNVPAPENKSIKNNETQTYEGTDIENKTDNTAGNATSVLKKFNSTRQLREFLSKRQQQATVSGSYARADAVMDKAAVTESAESAGEYSETNVQYANVDEADFIKNDDKYIYLLADNNLVIVDAYPGEDAEIISETSLKHNGSGDAQQLFLNEDKLMVFVEQREPSFYFEKYSIEPRRTYKSITDVYIYDINDRSDPELVKEYSVSGNYYQSRMIDDYVYLITRENTGSIRYLDMPYVESNTNIMESEVYYFDNPEDNYRFNTVVSFNIESNDMIESKTFMLGYSNTLMVSENNIYIAYQKQDRWHPWYYQDQYKPERFYEVILPELEGELKNKVMDVINKNYEDEKEWQQISSILRQFFVKLENNETLQEEYEAMFEKVSDAVEEYDTKKAIEDSKTVIHKIAIDRGLIDHDAKGEVNGRLLNQFSMDEFNGKLRVATTVEAWARKRIEFNNVYVLDNNLNVEGEITGIAEDEEVYSARFMGDKLYLVTFRDIDPFFVIDLSKPDKPAILGKLKIPGYSSYLHPYDENHIIGVGKETHESEIGGVKLSMFDVTNLSNPREIDKLELGERGSDSAALHDHKAFLFAKDKNLLVLPITEVKDREELSRYKFSNTVWHGAYVFNVTAKGFEITGKVEHSKEKSDYWHWWHDTTVSRSLYMDNTLYTVSNKYIKVNRLGDLENINSVNLPHSEDPVPYIRR